MGRKRAIEIRGNPGYKEAVVSYIKAEAVLPEPFIREIRNYEDGVCLCIRRKEGGRRM